MLQYLRNLSIRTKISGFVIPSTIVFGVLMTFLALYFLNDFKNDSLEKTKHVIQVVQENNGKSNIDSLLKEISSQADEKTAKIAYLLVSIVVVVIIMAAVGAIIISNLIGKPVYRVAKSLENISSGDADLTQRLPVFASDETGQVSSFFNVFLEKLQSIISTIKDDSQNLDKIVDLIHGLIQEIQKDTTEAKELSQKVFRSAGYQKRDMGRISDVMESSTQGFHNISTSVAEMQATIDEIARTSAKAHDNTTEATENVSKVLQEVSDLSISTNQIGSVTETITDISDQVNLLALNATIEAARAGEAGKGFAVVANEIKDLAKQTAAAAAQIKELNEDVQKKTRVTISGIENADKKVEEINQIVAGIASAVEEQSATATDISQAIERALADLGDSNEKVSEAAVHASNMADMSNQVTDIASKIDGIMRKIGDSADNLKQIAGKSSANVAQFKTV